jgi:hypothetical protein
VAAGVLPLALWLLPLQLLPPLLLLLLLLLLCLLPPLLRCPGL